jgi:hypothetical protein
LIAWSSAALYLRVSETFHTIGVAGEANEAADLIFSKVGVVHILFVEHNQQKLNNLPAPSKAACK